MKQFFSYISAFLAVLLIRDGAEAREIQLTLDEAIAMARVGSVEAAVALDELRTAYWEWRTFRADQLPEVTFNATAPSYSNRFNPYMSADGEYSFVHSNYLEAQGELSVTQNIRLTGAKLSLTTSLDFMRMFNGSVGNSFMTIPVAITLSQPLFSVNTLKWQSRIEPVRYREAKAAFLSATENVALTAVQYFFSLILSRENLSTARFNLENAQKLYSVALEKRKMGQISQNDLLQMEMNMLDARSDVNSCSTTLRSDMYRLRSFLAMEEDVEIIPVTPGEVPVAEINFNDALSHALANNKFATSMRRRQLDADYEVARAKGSLRQISLFVQVGYTGADNRMGEAYSRLRGNQVASIGFSIPLVDWGKRRGQVKVAESARRVTESRLRQEANDFETDLFVLIERFCNQQEQLEIARRNNDIARQRYNTNVETYLIGRISTLDLNDSQVKKDECMRRYVAELYAFWNYWYQIRSLTLFDYENHKDITADIERLVKM